MFRFFSFFRNAVHRVVHGLGWNRCRIVRVEIGGHDWIAAECVTCGGVCPLEHVRGCWCKQRA